MLPSTSEVLGEADRTLARQGRAALCQIVRTEGSTPGKAGWKMLVRTDGTVCGNLGGGAFEAMVGADASERLRLSGPSSEIKRYYLTEDAVRGEATGMVCGGMAEVLLEVLVARPLLVICGGGPVGQAIAQNGILCGFEALVVDDRAEFIRPELFPAGSHVVQAERDFDAPFLDEFLARELVITVVSRCWETDLGALRSVLLQAPPDVTYLGLMGSKRKVARILDELGDLRPRLEGLPFHAPIGLPIGGDTPGEIAVSVLAEIIQTRTQGAAASVEPKEASGAV